MPQARPNAPRSSRALLVGAALAVSTFAVYWQVKDHEFIAYDDNAYITENIRVQRGLTADNVAWAFTTGHAANWHPLTWLSHMLDCQIHGLRPAGHHLTNVALHAANAVLLLLVLHTMTGALWRSAFVAAVFALHPLHVESVAWAAERKDVLCAFFWMLAIAAYVRYARRPSAARYALVALLLALGLMAKPMLVTFPFFLLLLDYWPLGRMAIGAPAAARVDARAPREGAPSKRPAGAPPRPKGAPASAPAPRPPRPVAISRLLLEKMPLLALSIASCVVTFIVQRRGGAVSTFERTPLTARVENALVAYVGYLRKAIWPSDLAVAYPHPGASLPGATVALAALALVGATALALKAAKARPYVPVGWFWYLGTLVPVIGIVQVGPQAMADRYAYVPLVGAAIVVAWGAADLAARRPQARAAVAAAAIAAVAAMMVVTWSQVRVWRNGVSLWERAVARTRDNYIAVTNLGVALHKQGKIDEALSRYLDALRINARYEITHYNLGLAVAEQGKMDEAERHFREALRINPKYAEAHNNLGIVLATTGRRGEAIEHLTQALAINPDYVDALHNLGLVLTQEGRYDEAISRFSRVLALKPDHAGARAALARVEAFRK